MSYVIAAIGSLYYLNKFIGLPSGKDSLGKAYMKTFIITLILTLGVSQAISQDFHFVLKGGLNVSTWGGDDADDVDSKIGFNVGTYLGAKFSKVGIDGEILYSTQGTQDELDSDIKANNNYLLIPVLVKFYLVKGFNFYGGPQVGILLKSEITDGSIDIDTEDLYKTGDFSIVFGAGYEIKKFRVGARYNLGLTKLGDEDTLGDIEIFNRSINLSTTSDSEKLTSPVNGITSFFSPKFLEIF